MNRATGTRRTLLRTAAALSGGALLAACGQSAAGDKPAANLPPVNLTWGQRAEPQYVSKEQLVIDIYKEKRPHVTIERVAGITTTTLLATLAAGTAPDTAWVEGADMPNVVTLGALVEVTKYWARDAKEINKDDFYPPVMDDVTWQGKLWGTSFGTAPHQPVYNKDAFTRFSLPTPGELAEKGQWTFDAMVDLTRRATNRDGGGRPIQYGMLPLTNLVGTVMWLRSNGGDVLNADRTQVTLDTPTNAETIQSLVDLRWKHRVWPTADEIAALGQQRNIQSGAIGMEWFWHGGANNLRDTNAFEWDVVPNPKGKVAATAVVKGNGEVILKGSKQEEEGWQWIKHIASKEGDAALVKSGRTIHRRKSTEALFNKEFHPPAGTKWIVTAYNQGKILPLVPAWTEFNRIWNETMAPVWNNAVTVRSALTETHRQMQAAMAATTR